MTGTSAEAPPLNLLDSMSHWPVETIVDIVTGRQLTIGKNIYLKDKFNYNAEFRQQMTFMYHTS